MAKDPAALLYIDNWLVSTKEMKADERGWYLNLILHQYDKGDLPDDIEELANLADVRFSEYENFKQKWEQVLKQKFKQNKEGRLENDKAREILQKREQYKEKRSEAGKIGYIIKVAINELKATQEQVEFIKSTLDFENIDTKNKQVLKQVLKQTIKLYIDGDKDKDIYINNNINKDFIKKENWRNNFNIYLDELNKSVDEMCNDAQWISEQEKHNPNVDIIATIKKGVAVYWGVETEGYLNKKKSKGKDINWKNTFAKNMDKNIVRKQGKYQRQDAINTEDYKPKMIIK
jgi:uncharacterized protein YdaU (DUF1376 family)